MPKGLFPGRSPQRRTLLYVFLTTLIINIVRSQIAWTDFTQIRASQTSIYDDAYIPLDVVSQVSITFKTAFPAASTIAHRALVISGFENYLHYQMRMNVTINTAFINMFTVDVYVGLQTYVKQINVNYFFVITDALLFHSFFFVSTGNYRTLDLDSENDPLYPGLRPQQFVNQTVTAPYVDPGAIISAIYAVDYKNTEGVINDVQIKTWMNPAQNILRQKVTVDEKGILFYVSITTIIIRSSFYPNPNIYRDIAQKFEASITPIDVALGTFNGLDVFEKMDRALLFDQTQNSLFFGISGFKFTMEDTRLFLLQIATTILPILFSSNLQTNPFMKEIKLSGLVIVKRVCTIPTEFYYVQGFECQALCTDLLEVTGLPATQLVCTDCLTRCDNGCVGSADICTLCATGNNRVKQIAGAAPQKCICEAGFFENQNKDDVCQKCADNMAGCLACDSRYNCIDCGNVSIITFKTGNATHNTGCQCINGSLFLVSGICLDFPGCIKTNFYITGQFCQQCDNSTTSNFDFMPDLTDNRRCKCLPGYELNSSTNVCEDDCGDSKTINQVDACDDGNTQSGDGCSSTCKVEYGYVCTVQILGGKSKCAEKQQISITYLYTQKNLIANQATLVFSLLPQQHLLAATTFENSITLNVNGNKKIRFDPITSLIYITIDYTIPLEGKQLQVNFTLNRLKISSPDINLEFTLNGHNAKISTTDKLQQTVIIIYVGLAVSGFSLLLALLSSFLGEKMIGIELILPVQAVFFTMSTLPKNIYSPISALWSMKFSNGYNILTSYDLSTNYMLDNRAAIMQYTGQYILNYNIMFLLLAAVILIIGAIAIRIAWLQRQQRNLQALQKKKQDEEKLAQPKKKKQKAKQKVSQNQKTGTNQKGNQNQSTEQQTQKQDELDMQNITEDLQDARQNIKNWKNFMYMIFDRFFSILIITAMSKVIFCFYLQLSNLTYTAQIYDNSLNAGFFFMTYATIVTGLYAIVYDYKTDKLIVFTCNKGKYAIMYIFTFAGYIIILGALFETGISAYIAVVFAIIPLVLIPYQIPYGMTLIGFQNIIAFICQLPFLIAVAVSVMLNIQGQSIDEPICIILAYAIIGSTGLSNILTIIRLIKVIDCKKVSCFQFTDRKKQNANDKNKKKNKVMLLQLDMDKEVDEFSEDSVRAVLFQRKKHEKAEDFNIEITNKQGHEVQAKKDDLKKQDKQKEKKLNDEDDDEQIDELEKIKIKLRKQLKQKKAIGKIK